MYIMAFFGGSRGLRQWLILVTKRITSNCACSQEPTAVKSCNGQFVTRKSSTHWPRPLSRCYSSRGDSKMDNDSTKTDNTNTTHKNAIRDQQHPVPLDYDLDQLLENIRQAQLASHLAHEAADTHYRSTRSSPLGIEELVEFLKEEKAEDVCVIRVPPEREYVKYFVTCVGMGGRHIQRMADSLAAECKRMRDSNGKRRKVAVEGRESEDWVVVYLGDTVVHFLTEESRQLYQLEQLWTLGHCYDDLYQRMEKINLESDALK